jgi:hypothetical protein
MPSNGAIKAKTAFSIFHMVLRAPCKLNLGMEMGCDIVTNRTNLVNAAIKDGATHILFVDWDMYFMPELLDTLLHRNKDIIGINANFRRFPLVSVTKQLNPGIQPPTDEPFECQSVGTGVMLVKLSVFKNLPKPWFKFEYDAEGNPAVGEDDFFCREAQKAGFEVWCDPTIPVKHIGDFLY